MAEALLFAACVALLSAIFGIVFCCAIPYDHTKIKDWTALAVIVSTVAVVGLLIASFAIQQIHWNQTCHRMGGWLDAGDCVKGTIVQVKVP
jgi:asparagine N-glycosylation enzyme membrane subunit Stt3